MSTKSKFKGRVICTKAQYEALAEKDPDKEYLITDDHTFVRSDEQNNFTAPNSFQEDVDFNKGLTSNGDIVANNKVFKVLDSTQNSDGTIKDLVTQYAADEIHREENTTAYSHKFPNKSGTFAMDIDLEGKLNVAEQTLTKRVYIRKDAGEDTTISYSYSPEGNSIAQRSPSGTLAVEDPTQEKDAVNKQYADALQKYLSLTGEEGTLEDDQYALVTQYDNLIIQRVGIDFRRSGFPTNGSGDYVFVSDYYSQPNGLEEWADYIITIKTDKTWSFKIKNHLQVAEQTYAPVVTLTPDSATNGTLSQDDFDNLSQHDDVEIILNKEYYRLSDNEHTPGVRSYVHTGWDGTSMQDKSINITLSTKAWTLKIGGTNTFEHIIKVSGSSSETGDEYEFMFIFNSNKSNPVTTQMELTNLIGNDREIPVSGYRKADGVYYPILSVKGTVYYYLNSSTGKSTGGIASLTSYNIEDTVQ